MGNQLQKSMRALGNCATWLGLSTLTVALWAGMYWAILYKATLVAP